jgi:hypothetical protein
MIADGWPGIAWVVRCGRREHLLRAWKERDGWRFEMDPPPCGDAEAVIGVLAGAPERRNGRCRQT